MPRKVQEINIIVHMPEDRESLNILQERTNKLFYHMVEKKFKKANLTSQERSYVVKRITENLRENT